MFVTPFPPEYNLGLYTEVIGPLPTPPPDRLPHSQHISQCLTHFERLCPQQNAHAYRGGPPGGTGAVGMRILRP